MLGSKTSQALAFLFYLTLERVQDVLSARSSEGFCTGAFSGHDACGERGHVGGNENSVEGEATIHHEYGMRMFTMKIL